MLNRSALVVRGKQPYLNWINSIAPEAPKMTLEQVNEDANVYLVEIEDEDELETWLKSRFQMIFTAELNDWSLDESQWPANRSLRMLKEWFSLDFHSVVTDLGQTRIVDDEEDFDDELEDFDEDDDLADPGMGRR